MKLASRATWRAAGTKPAAPPAETPALRDVGLNAANPGASPYSYTCPYALANTSTSGSARISPSGRASAGPFSHG